MRIIMIVFLIIGIFSAIELLVYKNPFGMGHMKYWWLFGFEWWGSVRPAQMWTNKGKCFIPFILGLWLRNPKDDRN